MPTFPSAPNIPFGFQERFSAAIETTFDTDAPFLAANAIAVLESDITPENTIIQSDEKTGNRLAPDFFKGLRSGKGQVHFYVKPGAVGVEPNYGPIYEAALSNKTIVGGTSVTYAHQDVSTVKTLRMARQAGNGLYEQLTGTVVESLGWDLQAGAITKGTATFAGARVARAKSSVLTGPATIATGTCAVAAGEGQRFEKGSMVRFAKVGGTFEDNGGLGYQVTSDALDTVTFTPVAVSTSAIGDEIQAFLPTPVTTGTVSASTDQDVTLAGVSMPFISAKINYKTGLKLRNNEGQSNRPTGSLSGASSVDGEIMAYFREDTGLGNISYSHWNKTFVALTIRSGLAAAGSHEKYVIPNVVVEASPIKIPNASGGPGMISLKFKGKTGFSVLLD